MNRLDLGFAMHFINNNEIFDFEITINNELIRKWFFIGAAVIDVVVADVDASAAL